MPTDIYSLHCSQDLTPQGRVQRVPGRRACQVPETSVSFPHTSRCRLSPKTPPRLGVVQRPWLCDNPLPSPAQEGLLPYPPNYWRCRDILSDDDYYHRVSPHRRGPREERLNFRGGTFKHRTSPEFDGLANRKKHLPVHMYSTDSPR
jgi:hypothetical protein